MGKLDGRETSASAQSTNVRPYSSFVSQALQPGAVTQARSRQLRLQQANTSIPKRNQNTNQKLNLNNKIREPRRQVQQRPRTSIMRNGFASKSNRSRQELSNRDEQNETIGHLSQVYNNRTVNQGKRFV